jgi:hypothetical protein
VDISGEELQSSGEETAFWGSIGLFGDGSEYPASGELTAVGIAVQY